MTIYSIITKNLSSKQELEEFLKTFSEVDKDEESYGEWGVLGERIFIPVNMLTFAESYFVDSILVRQVLNIEEDPFVISVYRPNTLDEPVYYKLIVAIADKFGGFIDYDGVIVEQIYHDSWDVIDEEDNRHSHYVLPATPVDLDVIRRELSKAIDSIGKLS